MNILNFFDIRCISALSSYMEFVDRPVPKRSSSFGVGLQRIACAFVCGTSAWNILSRAFFTKYSLNTYCASWRAICMIFTRYIYTLARFSPLASANSARSARNNNSPFDDQIRRRTASIFRLKLSYTETREKKYILHALRVYVAK